MRAFKIISIFIVLFLLQGCDRKGVNNSYITSNENIHFVFEKIKGINIDSLKNIEAYWRGDRTVRVHYGDSCNYAQFILYKRENDVLRFMAPDSAGSLVNFDSINFYYDLHKYGITKERIVYCFDALKKFEIDEINAICNNNAIYIKAEDSLEFCYVHDTSFYNDTSYSINPNAFYDDIKKPNKISYLKRLDKNWGVSYIR